MQCANLKNDKQWCTKSLKNLAPHNLQTMFSRNFPYSTHRKVPQMGKYHSLTEVQNYGTASQLRQSWYPP